MPFEIPTQIELSSTNLLIAGGVLHFIMATFMHYSWLLKMKKLVKKNNARAGEYGTKLRVNPASSCVNALFTYLLGPELKLGEAIAYTIGKVAILVFSVENLKPWDLQLSLVKPRRDETTRIY